MLMNVMKYSAISSKIRYMLGSLLSTADYEELMNKKTVHEVATYLKYNTHFRDVLNNISENTIHRGRLENILKHDLIKDYHKIFNFTKGDLKEFLRIAFLKYEIESLKMLFRVLETEGDTTLVEDSLLFLTKYNTLNIPKLSQSRNSQEFIANLRGTVYYDILRPFLSEGTHLNLFNIETTLDLYFFNLVLKKKDRLLKGRDAQIVNRSLGTEIDVFNILWIYRCKRYYNMDKEIIFSHIIPHRYKLSKETFRMLIESKDIQEFISIINQTRYGELLMGGEAHYYELNFSEYMYRMHKSFIRKDNYSIAGILSYIHLKEYELSNIVTIIEGIRYNLPKTRIRRFVVGIDSES